MSASSSSSVGWAAGTFTSDTRLAPWMLLHAPPLTFILTAEDLVEVVTERCMLDQQHDDPGFATGAGDSEWPAAALDEAMRVLGCPHVAARGSSPRHGVLRSCPFPRAPAYDPA